MFRGKDYTGRWRVGHPIPSLYGGWKIRCIETHCGETYIDEYLIKDDISQFTGLTDKNDTKIFEGDIVKADNGHISEVVFWKGLFCLICRCHGTHKALLNDNVIVIGNIHDNPELLEAKERGKRNDG